MTENEILKKKLEIAEKALHRILNEFDYASQCQMIANIALTDIGMMDREEKG